MVVVIQLYMYPQLKAYLFWFPKNKVALVSETTTSGLCLVWVRFKGSVHTGAPHRYTSKLQGGLIRLYILWAARHMLLNVLTVGREGFKYRTSTSQLNLVMRFFTHSKVLWYYLQRGQGVPIMAQRAENTTGIHEDASQSLASFSELRIWRGSELWCRLAAAAPIGPLA